jgi:hypothetical protein
VGKPLHVVLETTDLAEAHGQVRAGLEQAGCEVSRVRRTEDGFRLRGVRSGHGLATIAALIPPLRLFGAFSRTEVEAKCQRSLEDGDESLHVWIRARAIRELDDQAEAAWVTRGPDEAIGDSLQTRRVLKRLAEIFEAGVDAAPVEIGGSRGSKEERRAAYEERVRRGRRRRNLQIGIAVGLVVLVCAVYVLVPVVRVWFRAGRP